MIPSPATVIDTLLGLSLIGVAAAIHYYRRYRQRRGRRRVRIRLPNRPRRLHFRLRWLPVPLAAAGVLLIAIGWLWPDDGPPEPARAGVAALDPGPAEVVDASGHGIVLVRGTPTDDDSASEEDIQQYSQRLGTLVAKTLARPPLALALEPRTVDAEQWKAIREDPNRAREWCAQGDDSGFVAVIGLAALRLELGAGYAPWREPEYVIVSCATPSHASLRGRVDERLGDRVPYEQAITDDLRSALGKLSAKPE